MKYSYLVVNCM